jgi:hypothetical protein
VKESRFERDALNRSATLALKKKRVFHSLKTFFNELVIKMFMVSLFDDVMLDYWEKGQLFNNKELEHCAKQEEINIAIIGLPKLLKREHEFQDLLVTESGENYLRKKVVHSLKNNLGYEITTRNRNGRLETRVLMPHVENEQNLDVLTINLHYLVEPHVKTVLNSETRKIEKLGIIVKKELEDFQLYELTQVIKNKSLRIDSVLYLAELVDPHKKIVVESKYKNGFYKKAMGVYNEQVNEVENAVRESLVEVEQLSGLSRIQKKLEDITTKMLSVPKEFISVPKEFAINMWEYVGKKMKKGEMDFKNSIIHSSQEDD